MSFQLIQHSTVISDKRWKAEGRKNCLSVSSYITVIATKGSFIDKSNLGIADTSKSLCQILLEKEHTVPQDSLFRNNIFDKVCRKIQDKNEATVGQDSARLIFPSTETIAIYSATYSDPLIKGVNKGWKSAKPFYVLVHSLIILWVSDDLHSRMISRKSLNLSSARPKYFYVPFHGYLADVLPIPHVRSKVRRRGPRRRRSTECSQHDTRSKGRCQTI